MTRAEVLRIAADKFFAEADEILPKERVIRSEEFDELFDIFQSLEGMIKDLEEFGSIRELEK